jgi:hypothetical protein
VPILIELCFTLQIKAEINFIFILFITSCCFIWNLSLALFNTGTNLFPLGLRRGDTCRTGDVVIENDCMEETNTHDMISRMSQYRVLTLTFLFNFAYHFKFQRTLKQESLIKYTGH